MSKGKILSGTECGMNEQFQNLSIFVNINNLLYIFYLIQIIIINIIFSIIKKFNINLF